MSIFKNSQRGSKSYGFTLIEIGFVLAITSVLIGAAAISVKSYQDAAKLKGTVDEMLEISRRAESYYARNVLRRCTATGCTTMLGTSDLGAAPVDLNVASTIFAGGPVKLNPLDHSPYNVTLNDTRIEVRTCVDQNELFPGNTLSFFVPNPNANGTSGNVTNNSNTNMASQTSQSTYSYTGVGNTNLPVQQCTTQIDTSVNPPVTRTSCFMAPTGNGAPSFPSVPASGSVANHSPDPRVRVSCGDPNCSPTQCALLHNASVGSTYTDTNMYQIRLFTGNTNTQ